MKAFQNEKRGSAVGGGAPIRTGHLNRVGIEQKMALPAKRIERTSAGLRDALFDAIERVRDQEMTAEDAKALAGLAEQVCNTVELEIQVAKLRAEYPSDAKLIIPSPLPLGLPDETKK